MKEILESDWTLAAVKRREEERQAQARAASLDEAQIVQRRADDLSGNNWIAEAFRRRQEEERAKAARLQTHSDPAHATSKEVPVDNWLIEGFKRHQEEARRQETIAQSDATPDELTAPAATDGDLTTDPQSRPTVGGVASGPIVSSAAREDAATADKEGGADATAAGAPLIALRDAQPASPRRPGGAARRIAVAGLVAAGGLLSILVLKTALWSPVESPRGFDRGDDAPSAAAPDSEESGGSAEITPPGAETSNAPATAPTDSGSAPAQDAPPPAAAAPAEQKSDAAPTSTPPADAPDNAAQNPAPPPPVEQENNARAPSAKPGDNSPHEDNSAHENEAAPTTTPPSVPQTTTGAVPPVSPGKKTDAAPASPGLERAHERNGTEQEQAAPQTKRRATGANADAKSKPASKGRNAARRSRRNADGFSAFLKRTTNSVRKFFKRLGDNH
ncbi:MAG: hypothetical protein AB7F41_11390 [Methylocystis sp.]|uniref:hypothetical protein n=1 Tax=Methylocystis sp. TaxID=1911079 RepID=UPI003D11D8A7